MQASVAFRRMTEAATPHFDNFMVQRNGLEIYMEWDCPHGNRTMHKMEGGGENPTGTWNELVSDWESNMEHRYGAIWDSMKGTPRIVFPEHYEVWWTCSQCSDEFGEHNGQTNRSKTGGKWLL